MKTKSALGNRLVKFALGSLVIATAPAQTVSDDFESGLSLWQATGQWGLTTGLASSPSHSVTDTPGAFYSNNTDTTLSLTQTIDLNAVLRPALAFHHAHDLEKNYDFAQVEISTDNGVTWLPSPLASYTGSRAAMTREQLDLSAFSTSSNVKIRFRLVTDSSVVMDGWYLDDVVIGSAPVAVTLQSPTGPAVSQTTVSLTWSASSDLTFESYVILRGTTEDFDWRTAKTVAVITNPNTTACLDIAVAPKTAYRYKVMTLSSAGLHSLSNEVTASTPAGIDYPFLDDGEAGPNLWTATSPWALSDEDFQSPGHAWSDSPGGNYTNGISSQPLTLAAPLDLTTSIDPVLTFHHRYVLVAGDTANVEISTNLGSSWSVLATYTTSNSPWNQTRIPLSAYTGQSSVLVRFRLTTNASENADGWHVDDISVAEAPPTVAAPAVDEISSHTLRLTWNTNSYLPFSHYAIHRSTNPGVGINSPRVAVISNQAQSQFTDTALALDTMYYYRVYAVSPYGTYSADSSNETIVRTLNNPLPFTENFDENLLSWNFGSDSGANAWGLSTEVKRNGAAALGSSPGASYAQNSNTWAETAVDLRNTEWPVLTFWDRYGLSTGDWIRLEISGPGGPSLSIYGAYESSRGEWQRQRVDLSQWKGLSNVKLRFHLVADNAPTPGEGWFIDDLNVSENPNRNTPLVLPFTEDFESGATGWLLSNWSTPDDAAAKDGNAVLRFGAPTRRISPDCEQWAVLDRPIILPPGSKVQATYWVRGKLEGNAYQRLHYSSNGGTGWAEFASVNLNPGFDSLGDWKRSQASLETLAGQSVRLRLSLYGIWSTVPFTDISIDKLTLAQIPQPVALSSAVPSLRSVDLTWTESSLGGAFVRYEVWRSTTADVSLTNGQKIFETTLPGTTLCTDTGLNIGGTYFYKVFTVDDRDTYTPSNELSTTTVPVAITFDDPMDSMDNWVTYSNTSSAWSVRTDEKHGGTGSLAAVPVGQYAQATDSYIETAVDLRNTEWPVLTFWDRYGLSTSDWIRLEISGPGGPSLSIYGAYESSRGEWQRQRVDLSQWKGLSNVKLRFHLVADNAPTPGEGWFIDDLNVSENPNRNTPLVLPFTEDFESGASGWLLSNWSTPDDAAAKDGNAVLRFGAPTRRISPDCEQWAVLDRPIILPPGSKVEATYWVRGKLDGNAYQRLHYSSNGGTGWAEFASVNLNPGFDSLGDWKRSQASLETLAGQSVRLRLSLYGIWSTVPFTDISIDKLTLAQIPQPVALSSAVPSLRSVDLTWTESSLGGAFVRYEVWRSTTADVSLTNGQKIFETTLPGTTLCTDTGLNIGGTYFYKVFTVDDRDTYTPSNELSTTTVPVAITFDDPMDSMDNWVTYSNTSSAWSVRTDEKHGGTGSLAAVPVGQYAQATDSYIETAVDLRNTEWPVLTFWDRYGLSTGDWIRLEISGPGGPSLSIYGAYESSRGEWQRQRVDLSQWKGLSNVKLRFHLVADNATTPGEGWFIDDLNVSENPNRNTPLVLPFTEDFESGATGWLLSNWSTPDDAAAKDGNAVLRFGAPTRRISPDCEQWAVLDRPIILPPGSKVQATYWVRGKLEGNAYQRLHYSSNGGTGWAEFASVNLNPGFDSLGDWKRSQASLETLAGQSVRLRLSLYGIWSTVPFTDISIDKLTLAQIPQPVAMLPIDEVNVTSMKLHWIPSSIDSFQRYEVYRSTSADVTNASTLVATLTDKQIAEFADSGLQARSQYFYRVYVVDMRDTYSPSEVVSSTTLGVPLPFADDFATPQPGWTFTGQWQIQPGVGRNGSAALVDSPGDYLASTDNDCRFAINLDGTQWPILRYWDKHNFAGSSWGRVEVSTDNASWSLLNGVTGIRDAWQMQEIDLSPWKTQTRVFIRFHRATDGNLADGWTIDDLSVADRSVTTAYPVFEGFESGTSNWLSGSWAAIPDSPYAGASCLQDTVNHRYSPDTPNIITFSKEVDLTNTTNPQLTFFIRGLLDSYGNFRVQVSSNGGLSWGDISSLNRDTGFNSAIWIKQQASLAPWKGSKIRIRFVTTSYWSTQPTSDIFLDNIGIGEPSPGEPSPVIPFQNETVQIVRPTLTVTNAIDHQSDPLTHQFEVYADALLTQLVAEIPAVASGVSSTSWQVDIDLPDHAPYWWRARASDGTNTGPWCAPIVFNINEFNNSPPAVVIASPANDSLLIDGNGLLVWFQTSDPDLGDQILDYQIQIDDDYLFGSPEVDSSGITVDLSTFGPGFFASVPLSSLPGTSTLPSGRWFWRIRARDTRFASGAWPTAYAYFRLPTPYQRYLRSIYPDPEWFLDDVINPGVDPDGNGVGALVEFASAIAPGAAPGDRLPRPIENETAGLKYQGFEWTRRKNSELIFLLDFSTDLKNWQADDRANVEILHSVDDISERVRIIDPDPIGSHGNRFLRLRVRD